jgi:hypothetical protein
MVRYHTVVECSRHGVVLLNNRYSIGSVIINKIRKMYDDIMDRVAMQQPHALLD